jgi:DNA-binding CsgD family transcriptional regulator
MANVVPGPAGRSALTSDRPPAQDRGKGAEVRLNVRLHRQLPFAASAAWDRLEAARIESFIGRVTISVALIAVAVVIQLVVVPPERVEIILLAAVGLVIVTARWAGFWASVVTAFMAAALIDIVLLRPGGDLIVGSIEDIGAILLFLLVALLGARAARAPTPQAPAGEGAAIRASGWPADLFEPLTDREMVVLGLLARGKSNAEIADDLAVSRNTVKTHLSHLYGKLAVTSRTQAIVRAHVLHLI